MAFGPLNLALIKVGPIAQLLDVANDREVFPLLGLILYREAQIVLLLSSESAVFARRLARSKEVLHGGRGERKKRRRGRCDDRHIFFLSLAQFFV